MPKGLMERPVTW